MATPSPTPPTLFLRQWIAADGAQQPLIISGPDKTAIVQLVAHAGRETMCEQGIASGCEACASCRRVAAGTHSEVIDVSPIESTWTIKALRVLGQRLVHRPTTKRRLVILRDIEKLSVPAAHALLKTLEEPAATTRFILTTPWPSRLLPTILSRCAHLRVGGTSVGTGEDEIVTQLQKELRTTGVTPALRRAYMRLRDYYVITGKRGNTKLAREVLLLSVSTPHGMDTVR